jgi:hypothetical protein
MTVTAIVSRMVIFVVVSVLAIIFATHALMQFSGFSKRVDNGAPMSDALFGPTGDLAAIYNREPLRAERSRIILVGASNLILVPSPRLQRAIHAVPDLANYTANNISVEGVGIPSFHSLVELAYDAMPARRRGSNIFVVGLYYGFFYRKDGEPLERDFQKQITWAGLYSLAPDGKVNQLHGEFLTNAALFCLEPYIIIRRNFQTATDFGRSLMTFLVTGHAGKLTVAENIKNNISLTPQQKAEALRLRTQGLGTVQPVNFAYLESMARKISANGDELVLLDLPLPKWHRDGAPAFTEFRAIEGPKFAALTQIPGVHYVDLAESLTDDDFYDSVHPKPAAADHLAGLIASRLPQAK